MTLRRRLGTIFSAACLWMPLDRALLWCSVPALARSPIVSYRRPSCRTATFRTSRNQRLKAIAARLLTGTISSIPVAVLQGRVHSYEGYSPQQVTFPIRVLGLLGLDTIIVTNAAGGIDTSYHQGQLVVLSDHINLTGANPLVGRNDERLGLRFFDMSEHTAGACVAMRSL